MKHSSKLITVALVSTALLGSALADARAGQAGVKPKAAASHGVPMHPHQLTLYPHGKPERRQPMYSYTRHRFDQPTPIHNTFMGSPYR
jgi:hypothetical protein